MQIKIIKNINKTNKNMHYQPPGNLTQMILVRPVNNIDYLLWAFHMSKKNKEYIWDIKPLLCYLFFTKLINREKLGNHTTK